MEYNDFLPDQIMAMALSISRQKCPTCGTIIYGTFCYICIGNAAKIIEEAVDANITNSNSDNIDKKVENEILKGLGFK